MSAQVFRDVCKKKGKAFITTKQRAELFLKSFYNQTKDPAAALEILSTSENGLAALRESLQLDDSVEFWNNSVAQLFRFLGKDELALGPRQRFVQALIQAISETPFFLSSLKTAVTSNKFEDVSLVGWFLLQLITDDKVGNDSREKAEVKGLAAALQDNPKAKGISAKIRRVMEGAVQGYSDQTMQSVLYVPGGRHDNDHVDYRKIVVVPTIPEVSATDPPYLPKPEDDGNFSDDLEARHLDRLFRLLRQDHIGPLTEELKLLRDKKSAAKRLGWRTFREIRYESVGTSGSAVTVSFRSPYFESDAEIWKKAKCRKKGDKVPKVDPDELDKLRAATYRAYWELQKRKLAFGCLVCLVRNGNPVHFATVCDRDLDALSSPRPRIGLRFSSPGALVSLMSEIGLDQPGLDMVQLSTPLFAFEPILKRLQVMYSVPFAEEFVHWKPTDMIQASGYVENIRYVIDAIEAANDDTDLNAVLKFGKDALKLDVSQREAIAQALRNRVGLIQGPPGTGKSFCGALLAKVLFDNTSAVILCVSFTNHAVDQFLEDVLNAGVPKDKVVRLGSKSKISGLKLREKVGKGPRPDAEWRLRGRLRSELRDCETKIQTKSKSVNDLNTKNPERSWEAIKDYLEVFEPEAFDAFQSQDAAGYDVAGGRGKMSRRDLWEKWCHGNSRPALLRSLPDDLRLWNMPRNRRMEMFDGWKRNIIESVSDEISEMMVEADRLRDQIDAVSRYGEYAVLKSMRVIGCTTSGAARFAADLHSLNLGCLIVEEAGEVLESHILTSLSPTTEHCVLIGDHQQLRPKVNLYEMQVESQRGYELNRSLFERLVLKEFPHVTLGLQHRMRPSISKLVRQMTYPNLRDAPSVDKHPDVRGLQDNVVFIDHREAEVDDTAVRQRKEEDGLSRINEYECNMVLKTVRYLLQQGYEPDDLVVLTPYLSQLREIRLHLAKLHKVILSDLDVEELRLAGVDVDDDTQPESEDKSNSDKGKDDKDKKNKDTNDNNNNNKGKPDTSKSANNQGNKNSTSKDPDKTNGIRVSTIDNYQGEEANVVVASLVRSNKQRNIGFLCEPERVNVLLSRARHGMVLIGDSDTLENARKAKGRDLWTQVMKLLRTDGHVYNGLPTICQQHTNSKIILQTPNAFEEYVPFGGCTLPCQMLLPCGHDCPQKCHFGGHKNVKCLEVVTDSCKKGHALRHMCGSPAPRFCGICTRLHKEEMQRKRAEAEERKKRDELEAQYAIAVSQHEAEINKLKAEMETMECEEKRKLHLQKLKAEQELLVERQQLMQSTAGERKAALEAQMFGQVSQKRQAMRAQHTPAATPSRGRGNQSDSNAAHADYVATGGPAVTPNGAHAGSGGFGPVPSDSGNQRTLPRRAPPATMGWWHFLRPGGNVDAGLEALLRCDDAKLSALFSLPRSDPHVKACCAIGNICDAPSSDSIAPALNRGIELYSKEKWLDAIKSFQSIATAEGRLFSLLCRQSLDPHDKDVLTELRDTPMPTTLAGLYAYAMLLDAASQRKDEDEAERREWACSSVLGALCFMKRVDGASRDKAHTPLGGWKDSLVKMVKASAARECTPPVQATTPKKATAETIWKEKKSVQLAVNKSLDKLMELTGLEEVKTQFLAIYNAVQVDKSRGTDPKEKRLNVCLRGNPGTGKTTCARIYASFLVELGVLEGDGFEETTGAKLVDGGVDELKKLIAALEKKKGGVLFIDEAYQMDPKTEFQGKRVLDYLLTEAENKIGKLVFALAGYKSKMESLFEHNEGLPSRFPYTFEFVDYNDDELLTMTQAQLRKKFGDRLRVEGGLDGRPMRILVKRLGRGRGKEGFGNARAVANLVERVVERQASRLANSTDSLVDLFEFLWVDLLGPDPTVALGNSEAFRELDGMVGLDKVKEAVTNLCELVKLNVELEKLEKPTRDVALNRLFLGNPGTGKTTVAKLYGQILKDLGLLSKGEVIVKKPNDFIGSATGVSEKQTGSILKAALGNVLVIDEAYGLYPGGDTGNATNPYKTAVIDTIVGEVHNVPGDDRCVLMLGYREQMEVMMDKSNPGLARRFAVKDAFVFDDYTDEELFKILSYKLGKLEMKASYEAKQAAIALLGAERRRPNFGNGGSVENLISAAITRMNGRISSLPVAEKIARSQELLAIDFDPEASQTAYERLDVPALFSDLIGCRDIISQMEGYRSSIEFERLNGRDPLANLQLNFLFVGSPGTGKTTVARRMGKLFHALGVLDSDKVIEASASDLIGQYVGHSAPATQRKIQEALGRVLFIDEAYRLNPGKTSTFAQEALDELVDQLTKPNVINKLVVILAGYPKDMDDLMQANAGLSSRFSERVCFDDFTPEECFSLLDQTLRKGDLTIEPHKDVVLSELKVLMSRPGWGNGRDIATLAKTIQRKVPVRLRTSVPPVAIIPGEVLTLIAEDALIPIREMLKKRPEASSTASHPLFSMLPPEMQPAAEAHAQPPPRETTIETCEEVQEEAAPPPPSAKEADEAGRDPGVSDAIWLQLQEAKEAEEQQKFELRRALEREREIEEQLRFEAREAEKRRLEEEKKRLAELKRKAMLEQKRQEKLRNMGVCVAGYQWIPIGDAGYRCAGGSHFVPMSALQ